MADTGASPDPKGEGKEQELARPAGESQGDGNASGDVVSKTQFLGALKSANEKYDALKAEFEQLKAEKARPAPPKEVTRAELDQLVLGGDLTRAQADDVLEKQTRAAARAVAKDEAGKLVAQAEYERRVNTELETYREMVPKAWEAGSPEYLKGQKEFNYLIGLGHQPGLVTELAALRAAFGDIDTLRTSKSARRGPAETHVEAGGGDPEDAGGRDESASLKLTPKQRAYYSKGIEQGRYKSWKDVKAELEFQPGL
jgi:hypothetical protein